MVKLIVVAAFWVVWLIYKTSSKNKSRKISKKMEEHLSSLPSFTIPFDDVRFDGFHWNEQIPKDVYGQTVTFDSGRYHRKTLTGSFADGFRTRNKVEKKFKTKMYLSFSYSGQQYELNLDFPLEHTVVRLKCYMQKRLTVFVEEGSNDKENRCYQFLLDFRFMEHPNLKIIVTDPTTSQTSGLFYPGNFIPDL